MSRAKANGYQPSMYNCSGRRSNSECHNKYMTDITLGGFIFNYVSNMMRLRREFKPSWTVRKISKVLLAGPILNTVTISPTTLSSIRVTLLETVVGTTEYHSAAERATRKSSKNNQQESTLQAEIDRITAQANRYADTDRVKNAIGTTQLHKIVVVYKGMEMRVCEEVNS